MSQDFFRRCVFILILVRKTILGFTLISKFAQFDSLLFEIKRIILAIYYTIRLYSFSFYNLYDV